MSITRGRRSGSDTYVNDAIRALTADRRALRSVLDKILSLDEFPVVTHDDGSKWVDRDWLVATLREVLP